MKKSSSKDHFPDPFPSQKNLHYWLSYIESLHTKVIALGLERLAIVAEKLKLTAFSCPVVTVGGTNGKGSCVAFLASILSAANYRVGTYTSPHLVKFNERIQVCQQVVDDEPLVAAFEQVEAARGDIALTYFEFTTLAALVIFKAANLDAVILEVGLGGRLDAVNIVEPDVSVITTIALDHMDWLGDTREKIGYEKAGIFRSGKPAICGDADPPVSVIKAAEKVGAQLYCMDRDFNVEIVPVQSSLSLPVQNAATALMALQCLQDRLPVTHEAIIQGLKNATLPGRFQTLKIDYKEVILDVAHNPAAAQYLAQRLQKEPHKKTFAVVSILSDKDILQTLKPLVSQVDIWYVATLEMPRGSTAKSLANCLQKLGVAQYDVRLSESVETAFQLASQEAQLQDRILVFGSFHTVAEVLELFSST